MTFLDLSFRLIGDWWKCFKRRTRRGPYRSFASEPSQDLASATLDTKVITCLAAPTIWTSPDPLVSDSPSSELEPFPSFLAP